MWSGSNRLKQREKSEEHDIPPLTPLPPRCQESLDSRHRLLCKQREDAKDLKDNLDRRESVVSAFLAPQLSGTQLGGYRRFVQTTASLLIRQKDLEERRQLAQEQAEALRSSLPPGP